MWVDRRGYLSSTQPNLSLNTKGGLAEDYVVG